MTEIKSETKTEVLPPDAEAMKLVKQAVPAQGAFLTPTEFDHAQRVGKMLVKSPMVPEHFRGEANLANAVIAVDLAFRMKLNPLMVMGQIYMVHGKPGMSAQLVIATINCSEKFTRLKFETTGEGDERGCVASAKDLASGEILVGTRVTMGLAKKEGWFGKAGSKWQTMPEQMLVYRSASFWGRMYAPELLMGLSTIDELEDIGPQPEVKVSRPLFKQPEGISDASPISSPPEMRAPTPPPDVPVEVTVEDAQMQAEQKSEFMSKPNLTKLRQRLAEFKIDERLFLAHLCDIGVVDTEYASADILWQEEPFALNKALMKFDAITATLKREDK